MRLTPVLLSATVAPMALGWFLALGKGVHFHGVAALHRVPIEAKPVTRNVLGEMHAPTNYAA